MEPINIPVLALRGLTVFPHMSLTFDVERQISIRALERAMEGDQAVFLVTQREIGSNIPGEKDLYEVGTISHITQIVLQRGPGDGRGKAACASQAAVADRAVSAGQHRGADGNRSIRGVSAQSSNRGVAAPDLESFW